MSRSTPTSGQIPNPTITSPMPQPSPLTESSSSHPGHKYRRLEMPIFVRENTNGWLLRAIRFFDIHKYSNAEQIEAMIIAFEGDALIWYQLENKRRAILSWTELQGLLLKQFRTTVEGSLHEQWMELRQENTIAEYRRQFITRSAPLDEVSEVCFIRKFVSGLKADIKRELRLLRPIGQGQAMDLAQLIEDKLNPSSLKARASGHFRWQLIWKQQNATIEEGLPARTALLPRDPPTGVKNEIRRLTDVELQQHSEKGLCYRCDEKFYPRHHYKRKELSVMVVQEEEIEDEVT